MYFAALKTNGKIIIFKLGANFVRLAGVLGEAMVAPGPVSQRDTVEYVNFLLIVGRMTLPQYWRHLNNLLDGTVLVHSMARVRAPGYTNFKVVFQENFSTGHHYRLLGTRTTRRQALFICIFPSFRSTV